ncbi:MAG: glycosaminoglycan attachment site [Pseudomonadota bacterium]
MDLFATKIPEDRLHRVFQMLCDPQYLPERRVLEQWAAGFIDRDGKFANEFQTTFESSMWELYLHAYLKELGATVNFSHHAPDFVVDGPEKFCIEATIAAPAQGEASAIGYDARRDIPEDFGAFNAQAAIRIANSLSSKLKKYRTSYSKLSHVQDRPFVIAIAAFDRPFAHFAASRPIMAALYGVHYDEQAAIALGPDATEIPRVPVDGAYKNNGADVPLGFFCDDANSEISAVIYSCLATWGKIRALADNPHAHSIYQTFHPAEEGLIPVVRTTMKSEYSEHLLDGLHVFHNPFAARPLNVNTLGHDRLAQFVVKDDGLHILAPDDFLLMRMLRTVVARDA